MILQNSSKGPLLAMLKSMFFKVVLLLAVVLGVPGAVIGYWYYTSRPSYLLERGHQALVEKGERKEAERLALLLQKKGYIQAARLLRGEILVYDGQALQNAEPAPFPYEDVQRAAQMVMGGGGLNGQPLVLREVTWLTAFMYQVPIRAVSSSQNSYRMALAELTKIQDEGPNGIKGTILAAECLVRLGEQRLAAEGLTVILKRDPNNKEAHRWLAAIYMDLNSADDAIEQFTEWARLDPADGLPYRWIGFFMLEKNEVSAAREAYQEALKRRLRPKVKNDVLKELAEIYSNQLGEYQLALDTLEQGSQDFLETPEILALRVECLTTMDRQKEVEQLVEAALKKDPNFVPGLFLKAQKLRTEDKPKEALPLLEKAIQREPHNLKVGTALMVVYRQVGDPARADEQKRRNDETQKLHEELSELERQAKTNEERWNDAIRLRVGELHLKLGHQAQARMWLESCLACNPNNYLARRLVNQIPREADLKGQ
jgi:tetratricopeptide (TPR) repeat protein